MEINVKEARAKISSLLDKIEKGEDVVIVRRGKKVARLVAVSDVPKQLPDLRSFRDSIPVKGKSLGKAVIEGREEERF